MDWQYHLGGVRELLQEAGPSVPKPVPPPLPMQSDNGKDPKSTAITNLQGVTAAKTAQQQQSSLAPPPPPPPVGSVGGTAEEEQPVSERPRIWLAKEENVEDIKKQLGKETLTYDAVRAANIREGRTPTLLGSGPQQQRPTPVDGMLDAGDALLNGGNVIFS
jgi:hypothetical protein